MAEDSSLLNEPGSSSSSSNANVDKEWELSFHGASYVINLMVANSLLTLEVEDFDSNERWSGEFTSQYLEDISLKAGNFKKFPTFVKMLCSGFSKDNESVFVDMLTAEDLEMLKARKTGSKSASSVPAIPQKGGKRYVILTYSGEFDRVHYPLPLSFEASPNPESLLRTVARLRRRLAERLDQQVSLDEANGDDKDLRQIISNLRQENQELRHRLRQADSRIKVSGGLQAGLAGGATTAGVVGELTTANAKLKRQVEVLRKELSDATTMHEKQRTEAQKELNKWKLRVGAAARDRLDFYSREAGKSPSPSGREGNDDPLKRRVAQLERELALARVNRRPPLVPPAPVPGSAAAAKEKPWNTRPPPAVPARRSVTPPPLGAQSHTVRLTGSSAASASWSPNVATEARRARVAALRASPTGHPPRPGARRSASASATSGVQNSIAGSSRSNGQDRPRSVSPTVAAGMQRISSSVGGRFDPTLYQRQRTERQIAAREQRDRPFSAGGRRPSPDPTGGEPSSAPSSSSRYRRSRESGYSSNDSGGGGAGRSSSRRSSNSKSPKSSKPARRKARRGVKASTASHPPASDSEDDRRVFLRTESGATRKGSGDDGMPRGPHKKGIAERSLIESSPPAKAPVDPIQAPGRLGGEVPLPFPSSVAEEGIKQPRAVVVSNSPARATSKFSTASSSSSSPRSPARRFVSAVTSQALRSSRDSSLGSSSANNTPRSSLERALGASLGGAVAPGAVSGSSESKKGSPLRISALKGKGEDEISEIDRRIQALQSYLDNARTGLLSETKSRPSK